MTPHGYAAVILDSRAGLVVPAPYTDTLTILGKGQSVRGYPKKAGEVWGLNSGSFSCSATRYFQMHPLNILPRGRTTFWYDEYDWLHVCPVPIYTLKNHVKIPQAVRYPLERIQAFFGTNGPLPFASSFDFMLALAILEGFTDITLAGVDYQDGTLRERLAEHVSLAFWVGQCRGRGIRLTIPGASLRFPWVYGRDYWDERAWGQGLGRAVIGELLNRGGLRLDDGQAVGRVPKRLRRGA